jgi:GAF domain-containing protein
MPLAQEPGVAAKLSTLGGLVKTLVPRAHVVAIFDRQAQVTWANDAEDHEDLRLLAADLMGGAERGGPSNSMRCVLDSAANYAFVMRGPNGAIAGALTLTVAGPFRRAGLLLPAALEARLAPLLAAGANAKPDSVERLVSVLANKIKADAIIVTVPGQKFEHSFSQPSSQLGDVDALRKMVSGDLAARPENDDRPVRVGKARTAPGAPAFSYLSVPLRRQRAVVGLLAAFAPHSRRPFSAQDTEFVTSSAAHLVRLLN